jgi:hypothetical protein
MQRAAGSGAKRLSDGIQADANQRSRKQSEEKHQRAIRRQHQCR